MIVALVPGQQKALLKLKRTREELSKRLTDVVDELGPQIYDNFKKVRMLSSFLSRCPIPILTLHLQTRIVDPAAKDGAHALRQRKGGLAVNEEASFLDDPMSWLDDRLFGWTMPEPLADGDEAWGDADY